MNNNTMHSLWSETVNMRRFDKLHGDIKTDVLVIGGGMTGILCAYFLKASGIDSVLVEGDRIGAGITKNTTAKITAQHGLIYDRLIKRAGQERAKLYLDANLWAVSKFAALSKDIPCDFEEKTAFVYSLTDRAAIEKESEAVNRLGFGAQIANHVPLPFSIAGAVALPGQAQFHPLKFISGAAQHLPIYEQTFVRELSGHTALTDSGRIEAKHIIIATHFPFINKHGGYFLKMYQHRSYAIALENAPQVNGMYLEETENGLSFRNFGDLLILGGGDHRTGKQGGNWRVLREFAKNAYPAALERHAWATQDCMTLDGVPYIGQYGQSTHKLYVATGFNKWGMTSSMVAAAILTDLVQGKPHAFAELFSPSRTMTKGQLLSNGLSALSGLLRFSKKRCPHLGCALQWNKTERTWDCPCHGSRFERSGKLIDNPATGGLKP